ncbi:uncharacterized protein [Miscanthus floridulus]|uniref:uncharacterized protein n=1 Tax=Miscanthus floridulus TaxID=154761 RepID=UPI0034582008
MAKDENPPTLLLDVAKTLLEEIFMQEQKFDSLPIESDSAHVDTQTVKPLVQQTIDDTNVECLEPIQPDTISASSAVPSPQIETTPEKVLNSPVLNYSFNLEEYIDEDEISSLAISSKKDLSEETKNRLRGILLMLEKDIAYLVQDADSIQRVFLAIKDNLSSDLIKVLSPLSIIEDQALKVKKAQRNLSNHETLMAKKYSNKQEAKELAQMIDNMKNSSSRIETELNQLRARHAELEKELESVKAAIDCHESNLVQIPNAIKQKKQEMLTKVKEGKAIYNSLENILGSAKEDKQQIIEVDAIRLKVLKAIQDVLNL